MTGAVMATAGDPHLGLAVLRQWRKDGRTKSWDAVYKSLRHLQNRGQVKFRYVGDGRFHIAITQQGRKTVQQLEIHNLQIPKPPKWDKIWRVVIFDVPNTKSKQRLAFSQHLKTIGFQMAQKSVWIYPHPCHQEIMILRKFYDIESFVTYLETRMVEDDVMWRDRFDL